jgi:putative transposase
MILHYKYEIDPTEEQQAILNRRINLCRQTYNSALLDKSRAYQQKKQTLKTEDKRAFLSYPLNHDRFK